MKKSYYAVIPANVRYDKELTDGAKLLYGEITALCNQEGYCWASNSYFSELYGVSKVTISNWIGQLRKNGYVTSEITYKEGSKEIDKRYLRIVYDPIKENFDTPIKENFKENNTVFNNTSNSSSNAFAFYQENFGVLSPFVAENIEHWIGDLNEELVIEAMKLALKANKKFNYAEGILKDWLSNNVKTLDDVKAKEVEFKNRKPSGGKSSRKVARF